MFPSGIPACGTDALRFTLCSHNIRSHFIAFDATECHTNKLFFNKIWQATRFTLAAHHKWSVPVAAHASDQQPAIDRPSTAAPVQLTAMDLWILHRLATTVRTVRSAMSAFQLHVATGALKTFFYQNLCDVYVETTKAQLAVAPALATAEQRLAARLHCAVLRRCLLAGLAELASFAPFVCHELQQHLGAGGPTADVADDWLDDRLAAEVDEMLALCAAVRQLQSEHGITRRHRATVHVHIVGDAPLLERLRQRHEADIRTLCQCAEVRFAEGPLAAGGADAGLVAQSTAGAHCQFGIEVAPGAAATATATTDASSATAGRQTVNERKRQKLEADLERLERTVSNEGYRRAASARVQQQHGEKVNGGGGRDF